MKNKEVVDLNTCIIVTSDAVAYGLKEDAIKNILLSNNFSQMNIHRYVVVPNSLPIIINEVRKALTTTRCNLVIVTGGTGVSSKDMSIDVVKVFDGIELEVLGDALRIEGLSSVGLRSFASRATAKLIKYPRPCLVMAIPGNPNAVELALKTIVKELIPHILYEALKK